MLPDSRSALKHSYFSHTSMSWPHGGTLTGPVATGCTVAPLIFEGSFGSITSICHVRDMSG